MLLSSALRRALLGRCLKSSPVLEVLLTKRFKTVLMAPKRKRATKAVATSETVAAEATIIESEVANDTTASQEIITPRRRKSARAKKSVSYADQQDSEEKDVREESPLTDLEAQDEDDAPKSPVKKRRRKKDLEPVVYDIPPVENKETTFKGMSLLTDRTFEFAKRYPKADSDMPV